MTAIALPDYYRFVPTDSIVNIRWRLKILQSASKDVQLQTCIRTACWEDPCFFFGSLLWSYDPRAAVKLRPFCLWPHQIRAIQTISDSLDEVCRGTGEFVVDLLLDKSRAQGGTAILVGEMTRRFLRDEMFAGALMSRNMDCVDNQDDPDSLMSKVDFNLRMLPRWMLPLRWRLNSAGDSMNRTFSKHSHFNPDNRATIIGWASTGDAGRGGRKTWVDFDEVDFFDSQRDGMTQEALDSTQFVTNFRTLCSTRNRDSGPFHEAVSDDSWKPDGDIFPWGGSGIYRNSSNGVKIVLDWRDNPTHNRLAYRYTDGHFSAVRPEERREVEAYLDGLKRSGNWNKLTRRGFVRSGEMRSKWYDNKCLQGTSTPRSIARELDRNPTGAIGKCFNVDVLARMALGCQHPLWRGDAIVVAGKIKFVPSDDGKLQLWVPMDLDQLPPPGDYAAGVDISTGSGTKNSANSVLVAVNLETGRQVMEYADSGIAPQRFATVCAALCEWLHNAYLIWEAMGPTGGLFARTVLFECGYQNVYREKRPKSSLKMGANVGGAGWADLFDQFWVAMDDGRFIPASSRMIKECGGWEWENGKIIYRGEFHGDRAIAGGLCCKALLEKSGGVDKVKEELDNDEGMFNMAGRLRHRLKAEAEANWNRRTNDLDGFNGNFSIARLL